ncbi:helix-turn-helix transcriptional regulator [Saccharibacillus sp. JS10]|uniref:helix-turn-helix domain-containing protein n=1 Tax=Saccharibacillus sp. JS10 TaxID=2950552 RepID=UPI00210CDD3D|nr:helix-turn-helix transcriptional regulator [Saccharibacillus sp. JS10]MCQ4088074.1 helix-turn-helix domain-containing protein [Saccharibacillus sp. JS10]
MQISNPLRSAIKQNMRKKGYNFSMLSEKSGIPRGSLSLIFVGGGSRRSPVSFQHLIKISKVLGLPEDAFFDLYIEECFLGGRPNRSRIEPFLKRCIELGHADCIEKVLQRLNGEARYMPILFKIAEEQNKEETNPVTARLYEYLLIHNSDRYSVEYAICRYRLFLLQLNDDEENNSRVLNAFSPYCDKLPDGLKLEALTIMGGLSFNRIEPDELQKIADQLIALCHELFGSKDQAPTRTLSSEYALVRPAAVYYSQGYVMKQIALCETGEYQQAEVYSDFYEDLSWLSGSDPEMKQVIAELSLFAYGNRVGCRLLDGNLDLLPEYARLLEMYPQERIPGLIVLLKTANTYRISIDEYLPKFLMDLQQLLDMQGKMYTKQVGRNRCARMLHQLSIYHFNQGRIEDSLQAALQSWELSNQLNNQRMFRLLASLALMYSEHADAFDL